MTFIDTVREQIAIVWSGDKRHPVHDTFAQKLKTDLGKSLHGFFRALVLLADQKQQDYGSENLTSFGAPGIVIRLTDKVSRLRNLLTFKAGEPPVVATETALDTWSDGIVYQGIGYLMQAGLWPREPAYPAYGEFVGGPAADDTITDSKGNVTHARDAIRGVAGARAAQIPISEAKHSLDELIVTTLAVCLQNINPKGAHMIPEVGHVYRHRRVPGTVMVDIVLPSYAEHETQICVVFHDLVPPLSVPEQMPRHLSVEPLEWFHEHYRVEDR